MAESEWQQPDKLTGDGATLCCWLACPRETSAADISVSWSGGELMCCGRGRRDHVLPQPCLHPPAPTCLSILLGLWRLLSSRRWWHPMAFDKIIWLKEFLVYCLWCGEEKFLSLDPELHVKYPTIVLHSLATWRTSCCVGSAQDSPGAGGGSTTDTSSKDRKRTEKRCLTCRSCQRLMRCSDSLSVGSGDMAMSWKTQDATSRRPPRPQASMSLPGSAWCSFQRGACS